MLTAAYSAFGAPTLKRAVLAAGSSSQKFLSGADSSMSTPSDPASKSCVLQSTMMASEETLLHDARLLISSGTNSPRHTENFQSTNINEKVAIAVLIDFDDCL